MNRAPEYSNSPAKQALDLVLQSTSATWFNSELSFVMIMNLVSALGASDRSLIWNYLTQYDGRVAADPETEKMARTLMDCALNYYADFVEPTKQHYAPDAKEREHLRTLLDFLKKNPAASAEEIEKSIYDIGRANYDKPGKVFTPLYRVLLGQERGPRLGAFIKLATPQRMSEILERALAS